MRLALLETCHKISMKQEKQRGMEEQERDGEQQKIIIIIKLI